MDTLTSDHLLDTPALAELLGLAPAGIRNMLCRNPENLPPPVRIGRRVRWRRITVERWLASREAPIEPLPHPRGRPRNGPEGFPAGGRSRSGRLKRIRPGIRTLPAPAPLLPVRTPLHRAEHKSNTIATQEGTHSGIRFGTQPYTEEHSSSDRKED